MKTITIPSTKDQALKALGGVASLITAKEWERAAVVTAFTHEGGSYGSKPKKGGVSVGNPTDTWNITDFAKLGILGLTTRESVIRYRKAWLKVAGLAAPQPGESVTLPTMDFPASEDVAWGITDEEEREALKAQAAKDHVGPSKVLDIASNPKAMASAIKGSLKVSEVATKALADSHQHFDLNLDDLLAGKSKTPAEKKKVAGELLKDPDVISDSKTMWDLHNSTTKALYDPITKKLKAAQDKALDDPDDSPLANLAASFGHLDVEKNISDLKKQAIKTAESYAHAGKINPTQRELLLALLEQVEDIVSMLHTSIESGNTLDAELADLLGKEGNDGNN